MPTSTAALLCSPYRTWPALAVALAINLLGLHGTSAARALAVDVMSFNLRVPVDPAPHDWASRRARVVALVRQQQPDVMGVQEAVPEVVADLGQALGEYASVGRGREADGGGEGTQIFYRTARWRLDPLDQGTVQLSSTPELAGSNDWGMQWPRIATWVHLREHASGRGMYVYNTHYPLKPEERERASRQLASLIAARKHGSDPVVLTGDLNACSSEPSVRYLLDQAGSPVALYDSYRATHGEADTGSFHAFGKEKHPCRIDYIMASSDVQVLRSEVLIDGQDGHGFASDHYAVSAALRLGAD